MLDSVSYLTGYGWKGKGTALREGALSRPIAIPQKRTLAGLGKDRDEAFPFWDHLFAAASKSIKIKLSGDDDDDDDSQNGNEDSPPDALLRTTTGILSNRRPISISITSGSATPSEPESSSTPRLSLLAMAKRESARKRLYASFFRGPILGPDTNPEMIKSSRPDTPIIGGPSVISGESSKEKEKRAKAKETDNKTSQEKEKESKKRSIEDNTEENVSKKSKKGKGKERAVNDNAEKVTLELGVDVSKESTRKETREERQARKAAKVERRKAREAKKRAKEELRKVKEERRNSREERRKARELRHKEKEVKKLAKKGLT
ncbi:hypothetical protein M422DRAFT_54071 [Sphaerobolus stellatus SS14]|uniref:G-patch domain-containing protein n=1 Tax=Sphaerobolus stellatus (strain SS14) TaxID=990650 RepID=A0A0C9U5S3_SPHS4|nr:hypothetical protein M422DRAFT_54071 [Sphaerobolus stellatus SS14]